MQGILRIWDLKCNENLLEALSKEAAWCDLQVIKDPSFCHVMNSLQDEMREYEEFKLVQARNDDGLVLG